MIIECPSCAKRISSKYTTCPHCKVTLAEGAQDPGLTIDEAVRRQRIRASYRVQAQMYLSIFLAVAGVAWAYVDSDAMTQAPGLLPTTVFAAGALWYVFLRLYMIVRRIRG